MRAGIFRLRHTTKVLHSCKFKFTKYSMMYSFFSNLIHGSQQVLESAIHLFFNRLVNKLKLSKKLLLAGFEILNHKNFLLFPFYHLGAKLRFYIMT